MIFSLMQEKSNWHEANQLSDSNAGNVEGFIKYKIKFRFIVAIDSLERKLTLSYHYFLISSFRCLIKQTKNRLKDKSWHQFQNNFCLFPLNYFLIYIHLFP